MGRSFSVLTAAALIVLVSPAPQGEEARAAMDQLSRRK